MSARIPVTVLSGYLGAGKTTIINRLLTGDHGLRLGVLVNDFGPVNIDAGLIEAEGDDLVELSNGCVCCSIGDDLGEALSALAARPAPPERLLLEASGVAEPARIAMMAGHWPGFELDAVVVAADAETVQARARDKFVARLVRNQLQAADLIVLTKSDLVGPERLAEVTEWLRALRPEARVVPAVEGRVPVDILLGAHDRSGPRAAPDEAHVSFATTVWRPKGPVDRSQLQAVLEALPPSVQRVKGMVQDAGTGAGTLVQAVGPRCRLTPAERPDDPCLVLIATGPRYDLDAVCARLDGLAGGE